MSVTYPLFVFERDDESMRLIENPDRILYYLEAIDIENEEYVFWDAQGSGVSMSVTKNKLANVASCPPLFPITQAFGRYARALGLSEAPAEGTPIEVWNSIQAQLASRPQKRSWFSRLTKKS